MKSSSPAGHRRLALAVALLAIALLAGSATVVAIGPASGPAKPKPAFTVSGGVHNLYPGAQRRAVLRIKNKRPFAIQVRRILVTVTSTNKPGCPRSMVKSPGWAGSVRVPRGKTRVVRVPIRMRAVAPQACQGAVFALRYTGRAVRPRAGHHSGGRP
ncbi:hypothetical protein [Nocardioides marmotae]|uniref:hypothetical protein n=1 Tax=Nocardioides marmotae TaxID=2663857 RepID=UPI0012B5E6F6|nr:hypothetical protein [Nocardioides marmotae]MBC9734956.1 hypothetical protein [Nocardioides marmotae]MTB86055.1 hypothetical protein [Nocardioides marmotae]